MTKHEDNGKRRRDRDRGAERIADNTYLKLVARIVLPIVGGLALFMLVRLVDKFDEIFAGYGAEAVITSGVDGKHSRGSIHYSGGAVDLRSRDMTVSEQLAAVKELKERLGPDFDVILEGNHIHLEYQPHEE